MCLRDRAMVTLSSTSKKSKSSCSRMVSAVRCSGGSFDHALKTAWARRKISSMSLPTPSFSRRVAVESEPVVGQLLGTEHKDGTIAKLVILDDGQSGECLPQADAVGKDAAVVRFQLVDDARGSITLEVVELFPNETVLIAGQVVG